MDDELDNPTRREAPAEPVLTGAEVPAAISDRVSQIATAYRNATGRTLHVTSGVRTPRSQANAMYTRIRGGERGGYANVSALAEILTAFDAHPGSREAAVAEMERVIQAQVDRGVFISDHLSGQALDLRLEPGMTEAERATLRAEVERQGGRVLFEDTPPHIHIQF